MDRTRAGTFGVRQGHALDLRESLPVLTTKRLVRGVIESC
jgi:hypothetical protein